MWFHGLQALEGGPQNQNSACITSNDPNQEEYGRKPRKNDPGDLLRGLPFFKGHVENIERRFRIAVDWDL